MRTEDPCDRATVRETRKAAPRVPPIRLRVEPIPTARGDLATAPTSQANRIKHLSLVLPVPATLGPHIFESLSSLFTLFFFIGGNLG